MVTLVPPEVGPLVGDTLVIWGVAADTLGTDIKTSSRRAAPTRPRWLRDLVSGLCDKRDSRLLDASEESLPVSPEVPSQQMPRDLRIRMRDSCTTLK